MSSGHPRTCPVGQHKAGHLWAGPLPGSQHILAQTSVYAAASFRARCLLPRGAEPALSGCASQQVWLLLGGPHSWRQWQEWPQRAPACHLASWQAAEHQGSKQKPIRGYRC